MDDTHAASTDLLPDLVATLPFQDISIDERLIALLNSCHCWLNLFRARRKAWPRSACVI